MTRSRNLMRRELSVRLCHAGLALVCVPLGLLSKRVSPGVPAWVSENLAGSVYVMWWSFLVLAAFPRAKEARVVACVLLLTCSIEFLQLWHPPTLSAVRATRQG